MITDYGYLKIKLTLFFRDKFEVTPQSVPYLAGDYNLFFLSICNLFLLYDICFYLLFIVDDRLSPCLCIMNVVCFSCVYSNPFMQ